MKDEFEDLQRLIRLKRHEVPGEYFTEKMLTKLHRRMREDLLKKSSLGLLMERISTRFEAWMSPPQLAFAAAAIVVCGIGLLSYTLSPSATAAPVQVTAPAKEKHQVKDTLVGEDPKTEGTKPEGVALPASHQGQPELPK